MYTYNRLDEYLSNKTDRPAPETRNNTRVQKRDNGIVVKLHATDIILFHPDDSMSLYARDWRTITTKQRMNEYIPRGFYIYQKRKIWYLADNRNGWDSGTVYLFSDGITIHPDGTISGQGDDTEADRRKALVKSVRKYAKAYARLFCDGKIPAPSAADCMFCSMFEPSGMTDTDHLLSHIEESYHVPSLLNLVIESHYGNKLSSVARWFIGAMWTDGSEDHSCFTDIAQQQIRSSIQAYLDHRLGL